MFVDPSAVQLLVPLYTAPDRHYHGLDHIYFSLSKLTEYLDHAIVGDIEFQSLTHAIWFHDAIYSPYPWTGTSNERLSAQLFTDYFSKFIEKVHEYRTRFELELRSINDRVVEAILCTEFHSKPTIENLKFPSTTLAMLDIDMAGFARPFHVVHKSSDQILKEYAALGMDRKTMLGHRVNFLKGLLEKDSIYHTEYFKDTHEKIARENITNVIEETQIEIEFVL